MLCVWYRIFALCETELIWCCRSNHPHINDCVPLPSVCKWHEEKILLTDGCNLIDLWLPQWGVVQGVFPACPLSTQCPTRWTEGKHAYTHTHITHTHLWFTIFVRTLIDIMVFILYKLYILSPYTVPIPKPTHHRKHSVFLHFLKKNILYDLFACLPMGTSI